MPEHNQKKKDEIEQLERELAVDRQKVSESANK